MKIRVGKSKLSEIHLLPPTTDIQSRAKEARRVVMSACCAVLSEAINEATEARDEILAAIATNRKVTKHMMERARLAVDWFSDRHPTNGLSFQECCVGLGWKPGFIRPLIRKRLADENWHLNLSPGDFGASQWVAEQAVRHSPAEEFDGVFGFNRTSGAAMPRKMGFLQEVIAAGGVARQEEAVTEEIKKKLFTGPVYTMEQMGRGERRHICYHYASQYHCWVEIVTCEPVHPSPDSSGEDAASSARHE